MVMVGWGYPGGYPLEPGPSRRKLGYPW